MSNLIPLNDETLREARVNYTKETLKKYHYNKIMPAGVLTKLRGRLYLNLAEFEKWLHESTTKNNSSSAS